MSDTPIADAAKINLSTPGYSRGPLSVFPPGIHHEYDGVRPLTTPYASRNLGGEMPAQDSREDEITPRADVLAMLQHEIYAARETIRVGMQRPDSPDYPVLCGDLTGALENIAYYAAWLATPNAGGE